MPRGGVRLNAGRKVGAATKKTKEIAAKAAKEGISPLEYMLSVMRDSSDEDKRFEAAKAAAPYIHPRLAAIDATVNGLIALSIADQIKQAHEERKK